MTTRIDALRSANQHLQDTVKILGDSPDRLLVVPTLQTLASDRQLIRISQIYLEAFPVEQSQTKEEKQLRTEEEKLLEQANTNYEKIYQWCVAGIDGEIERVERSLTQALDSPDLPHQMIKTLESIKKYAGIFCTTFGLNRDQVRELYSIIKCIDGAINKQIRLMPLQEPTSLSPATRSLPLVPISLERGLLLSLPNELLPFIYKELKAPDLGALSAGCHFFDDQLGSQRTGIVAAEKKRTLLENCVSENYREDRYTVASCARAMLNQPNFQVHVPNDRIMACTAPGTLLIFDTKQKKVLNTCLFDPNHTLYQVNDKKIAIATNKNPTRIDLWDLEKGMRLFSLESPHETAIDTIRVQGHFLISKSNDEIKVWDIRNQQCVEKLQAPCNRFSIIGIVRNQLLGLEDHPQEGLRLREIPLSHIDIGEQVPSPYENDQFMLSGDLLFAKKGPNRIPIFNIRTGKPVSVLQSEVEMTLRLMKQSGNQLFVAGTSPEGAGKLQIFDLNNGRNIKTMTFPQCSVQDFDIIDDLLFISTEGWGNLSLSYYLQTQKIDDSGEMTLIRFSSPFSFFAPEGKLLMAEPTGITVRDFLTKTSLLLSIAENFEKEQPTALDRFGKLDPAVKNGIYSALYEIHRFEQTYWGCAEHAFLSSHGLTCTNQERTAAIYRYILKNICADLKANQTRKALKQFVELPNEIKYAIYAMFYESMTFKRDYFGCAEHAFLEKYGQSAPNEKRIGVIESFLAKVK